MADLEAREIPAGLEEQRSLLRGLQRAMGQAFAEEVAAISGSTAELARAVKPPLSLAQARTALEGRVYFEKLQERTARDFERWGLDAGFEFKDDMTVGDSGDENKLKALFETGQGKPAILVVPDMKPADLFRVLFVQAGLPANTNSYGYQNLDALHRINPRDIPELSGLHEKSWGEQLAAFAKAHAKASALQSPGVRVLFTPENQHAGQFVGESTTRIMQRAGDAGEVQYIDLAAEFVRARQMVDAALKQVVGTDEFEALSPDTYRAALTRAFQEKTIDQYMPAWGRGSVTRSPLEVFPNGGVSALLWRPDGRRFGVGYCNPAGDRAILGGRVSLA